MVVNLYRVNGTCRYVNEFSISATLPRTNTSTQTWGGTVSSTTKLKVPDDRQWFPSIPATASIIRKRTQKIEAETRSFKRKQKKSILMEGLELGVPDAEFIIPDTFIYSSQDPRIVGGLIINRRP